jgi:hypothetical protein
MITSNTSQLYFLPESQLMINSNIIPPNKNGKPSAKKVSGQK